MQGLGSTYLTLTTFGTTIIGVGIIIGGIITFALSETMVGKTIAIGMFVIGGLTIWASSRTRTHVKENTESAEKYGLILLGMAVLGAITRAIGNLNKTPTQPLPTQGQSNQDNDTSPSDENNVTEDIGGGESESN